MRISTATLSAMPQSRYLLVVGAALALLAPASAAAGHVPSNLTPGFHVPQAAPFGSFSPTLSASPTAASAGRSVEVLANVNPRGDVNGNIWVHRDHAYMGSYGNAQSSCKSGVRVYSLRNPKRPRRVATFANAERRARRHLPRPGAHQDRPLGCFHRRSRRGRPPALPGSLRCERRDAWVRPLRRQPPRAPTAALDREHASGRGLARALATGRGRPRIRVHRDPAGRAPRLARRDHPRQPRLPHLRRLRSSASGPGGPVGNLGEPGDQAELQRVRALRDHERSSDSRLPLLLGVRDGDPRHLRIPLARNTSRHCATRRSWSCPTRTPRGSLRTRRCWSRPRSSDDSSTSAGPDTPGCSTSQTTAVLR